MAAQILLGIMDKCDLFAPEKVSADDKGTQARLEAKLQTMHEMMMAAPRFEEGEG